MAVSPTLSLKSREIIGTDAFSRRRDVFGQHDTVFLPSPTSVSPTSMEVEQVTERGEDISSFRRGPAYSSMRETRRDDIRNELGFRERKLSDNFTSDLNQSDIDYRHSMTERTRRISKLRRDFLTSNLHEPNNVDPFARTPTRVSMPAPIRSTSGSYRITSPNIYKFPFAEPYATPPSTRKVFLDLDPVEVDGESKENKDPEGDSVSPKKHQSLPIDNKEIDHHKLFNELLKRYSPQPKPIDWSLPPTRPRVVAALHKSSSLDVPDDKLEITEDKLEITEEELEEKLEIVEDSLHIKEENDDSKPLTDERKNEPTENQHVQDEVDTNKRVSSDNKEANGQVKDSSDELDEKYDEVPEIPKISRQNSRDSQPKRSLSKDDNIPALLEKISYEDRVPDPDAKDKRKVKRKRSFLDKLLNRNKK